MWKVVDGRGEHLGLSLTVDRSSLEKDKMLKLEVEEQSTNIEPNRKF
jgi:hypothetical protein